LTRREQQRFVETHPASRALAERARGSLFGGVPMPWMMRWPGGFPVFAREAVGATVTDVDGNRYADLCLGDTGAMTGHAPAAAVEVIQVQVGRGLTTMLPTEDAIWVGEEMTRRFGLPSWQFTLSATDANRSALRLARALTGRPKILVYNYCYHGTVDETVASLRPDGATGPRTGNLGPSVDPAVTTKVVEFNDLPALEAALAAGDVACVLAEPALTNIGIVLPDPGYHAALRDLTRRTGTLLIIDETHTFCAGPGGYTQAYGLAPDMLTIGKPIGSGIASGALGVSASVAEQASAMIAEEYSDTGGIGGTLAGNALSLAAIRATLSRVLTDDAFTHMITLGERFTAGVEQGIRDSGVLWQVTRLGCRAEYQFRPTPPRTGAEAAASFDDELDRFMHLYALNRGILLTPFHMMALMSPATTADDVDRHTAVFTEAIGELLS
jgi:glutamate-1-semialdehyde 2,1-aminomutase